jgi:RimJ/RimL family protein N-acetyltransferase
MKFPEQFPVLQTERLLLRQTEEKDAEGVFAMESDPVAMRYWSTPPMQEFEQARAAVARAMSHFPNQRGIRWSIVRRADDLFLGHVALFHFSEQSAVAEIGYGLGRAHWGQGYMHEALTAVIEYAFGTLGARRLEADTHPRNAASLRALERVGFRREGLLRERWQVGDEISDSVVLGLLAREWRDGASAAKPDSLS